MDLSKDYYSILGIDKNTDIKDIKKAYRKKATESHPDKKDGDDSVFKEINESYQILKDNKTKDRYDIQSQYGKNYDPNSQFMGGGFSGFDGFPGFDNINDIFGSFFGGNRKTEFSEQLDIQVTRKITLKDVYKNNDIKVVFERDISCNICHGTGFDMSSKPYKCDVCDGKGHTWESPFGHVKCKYCRGTGKIHSGTCDTCRGKKTINKTEDFQLSNVYRIRESDTKYIKGYGHQSKHYINKRGSLILNIIYEHDNRYEIKSNGLYYYIDIHYDDAINGTDMIYNHLDDKSYNIKIPKKTKDKDILKMRRMGLFSDNKMRQDLFIVVNIIIDYDKI